MLLAKLYKIEYSFRPLDPENPDLPSQGKTEGTFYFYDDGNSRKSDHIVDMFSREIEKEAAGWGLEGFYLPSKARSMPPDHYDRWPGMSDGIFWVCYWAEQTHLCDIACSVHSANVVDGLLNDDKLWRAEAFYDEFDVESFLPVPKEKRNG